MASSRSAWPFSGTSRPTQSTCSGPSPARSTGVNAASGTPQCTTFSFGHSASVTRPISCEQQKSLTKAIDQSLASGGKPDKDGKPSQAIEEEDAATQEKRQALEHLLQRVPDDPGGLLRRKFLLEHQRRQQGGGDNG